MGKIVRKNRDTKKFKGVLSVNTLKTEFFFYVGVYTKSVQLKQELIKMKDLYVMSEIAELLEGQKVNMSGIAIFSFLIYKQSLRKDYLDEEKSGLSQDKGWSRFSYSDFRDIPFCRNDKKTIQKGIDKLVDLGYISQKRKGINVNSKGQVKSDAAYSYRVCLRKLIDDLDSAGLISNTKYLMSGKFKYSFQSLKDKWLNPDYNEDIKKSVPAQVKESDPIEVKKEKSKIQEKENQSNSEDANQYYINDILQANEKQRKQIADRKTRSWKFKYIGDTMEETEEKLINSDIWHEIEDLVNFDLAEKLKKELYVIQEEAIKFIHDFIQNADSPQDLNDLPQKVENYLLKTA